MNGLGRMIRYIIRIRYAKAISESTRNFGNFWLVFKGMDEEFSNFRTFFLPCVIMALVIGTLFLIFLATV